MKLFLSVTLCFILCSCAVNKSHQMQAPEKSESYILDSGDTLRVTVYGQEELSGQFIIDPSGMIAMPLIKDVKASGLTVRGLEDLITSKLEPKYLKDPKVSVEVIEYRSVYILGEVRTPGKYPYVPNMTVMQAVAVAGGHTYRAREDSAEVTRLEKNIPKTFTLELNDMIKPGDTIAVKRRWF